MANSHAWDEKLKWFEKMRTPNETKLKPNTISWDGKQCGFCVSDIFHLQHFCSGCVNSREGKGRQCTNWNTRLNKKFICSCCNCVIISNEMEKSPRDIKLVNSRDLEKKMQNYDYSGNYFDSLKTASFQLEFKQICAIKTHIWLMDTIRCIISWVSFSIRRDC